MRNAVARSAPQSITHAWKCATCVCRTPLCTQFLRCMGPPQMAGWLDHFTDGAEATGNGKLALRLDLPVGKPEGNKIAGEFTFEANPIRTPCGVPQMKP